VSQAFPAPTFGHAAEAFVIAHAAPGAWAKGTAVKYRQTLTALDACLAESGPAAAADVAVLGTQAGPAPWTRRSPPRSARLPRRPAPGTWPRSAPP
jgi:hypothetical protein